MKTKKLITFFLAIIMVFGTFAIIPNTTIPVSAAENGNFLAPIDPIPEDIKIENIKYIETAEQLAAIGGKDSEGKYYVLKNDIDLKSEWVPINDFRGTLDGQGYSINNLYVLESSNRQYAGLFGTNGGNDYKTTIKNLAIYIGTQGVHAFSDKGKIPYAGGMVGSSTGTLTNCYVIGEVFSSTNYYRAIAGGLIGGNVIKITNCYAMGNVSVIAGSECLVGGLAGVGVNNITNCYATGNVFATSTGGADGIRAGGLIGSGGGTNITNCYATGNVSAVNNSGKFNYISGTMSSAGGLAGAGTHITNSYATGSVFLSSPIRAIAGGLIGTASGQIKNCYATGDVFSTSKNNTYAGGLIGSGGTITNCYAKGDVIASSTTTNEGNSYAGGLIGVGGTMTNCYATGDVSASGFKASAGGLNGKPDIRNIAKEVINCYRLSTQKIVYNDVLNPSGESLSTAQMKEKKSFKNWDFSAVWDIKENVNNGYPYLKMPTKVQIENKDKFKNTSMQMEEKILATVWFSLDGSDIWKGDEIKWTSSNEKVMIISKTEATTANKGSYAYIRFLKPGTVTLKASLPNGDFDEWKITVVKNPDELIKAAKDFEKARITYATKIKEGIDKLKIEVIDLDESAERILKNKVIVAFNANISAEAKKYCYKAIMDMFSENNDFKNAKIKLSDIDLSKKLPEIEDAIMKKIINSITSSSINKTYRDDNDDKIEIKMTGGSGVFMGEILVTDKVKGQIYRGTTINSSILEIEKALNELMAELVKLQQNNLKEYLKSTIMPILSEYFRFQTPQELLKFKFETKANDAFKSFGFGDVNLMLGNCYNYYVHVSKLINVANNVDLSSNGKNILSSLKNIKFEDNKNTISDVAIQKAINELTRLANNLKEKADEYIKEEIIEKDNNDFPKIYKDLLKIYVN